MSVTNQTATGFEVPSRSTLLRMAVVVIGLIAGAILAVSLASRSEAPSLDDPVVEAPVGQSGQSIQAQIDRLNGVASQFRPRHAETLRWQGLADHYLSEPLSRGHEAEAQRWAGIALRYGQEPSAEASTSSGLGDVDVFEEKLWKLMLGDDPVDAQNVLPDF